MLPASLVARSLETGTGERVRVRAPLSVERLEQALGLSVYDARGEKVGELVEIFYNDHDVPQLIAIAAGPLGTKRVYVPVKHGAPIGDGYTVLGN